MGGGRPDDPTLERPEVVRNGTPRRPPKCGQSHLAHQRLGRRGRGSEWGPLNTLILHWNGKSWSKVRSPVATADGSFLQSVTATSPTNAWAVGSYSTATNSLPVILHWNGKIWSKVGSPVANGSFLYGVTATSATNAWAVGTYFNPSSGHPATLVLHWNGKTWSRGTSPTPNGSVDLTGVTATSPANAWAVGHYDPKPTNFAEDSLILHWNGKTWSKVTSPNPGDANGTALYSVTATSGSNAWAVGSSPQTTNGHTLELHWNGKTWSQA
jgi:hypothetical protein